MTTLHSATTELTALFADLDLAVHATRGNDADSRRGFRCASSKMARRAGRHEH